MGAWGVGSFESDDALDWLIELQEAESTGVLEEAFARILQGEEYLEAPDCCAAIAAAEVVAALRGKPLDDLPEEVETYLEKVSPDVASALTTDARRVIERVATRSELCELWSESDQFEAWKEAMANLQKRLG